MRYLQAVLVLACSLGAGPCVSSHGGQVADRPVGAAPIALITKTDPMAKAERLYHVWCSRCHGAGAISRSGLPDLPESISRLSEEAFVQITTHGLSGTGMPAMGRYLAEGDAERIRSYLESRAASR